MTVAITTQNRRQVESKSVNVVVVYPMSETIKDHFLNHLGTIQNDYLKQLLESLFKEPDLLDAYCNTPAGKLWHHNYLGGLLEHVVTVLDLAETLKTHYTA